MALNIFGKRFVCVFCDERMKTENAYICTGRIGICRKCFNALSKNAPSLPYEGTKSVSYIMAPFEYEGALRQAILDFKFKGCRAYAPLFAEMMREYLSSYDIWEGFDCIIPVPLHESRLRERGYNQSELVAERVSELVGVPMRTDVLRRSRATQRQSALKRFDRVSNVQGAFICDTDLKDRRIILFDDICTTGSTLQSCAEALESAGAEIVCALTFAIHIVEKLPLITY